MNWERWVQHRNGWAGDDLVVRPVVPWAWWCMAPGGSELEDRLIAFAVQVSGLCDRMPRSALGQHVAGQLARCVTSPFANYAEARAAESRRDFVHKLRICLKELRDANAWLQFAQRVRLRAGEAIEAAAREANELIAIFVASVRTAERRR